MAKRQITESVKVSMSYDEYALYDLLAQEMKTTVPDLILKMSGIGVQRYLSIRSLD